MSLHAPSLKTALSVLNVGPNSILVIDGRVIDVDSLCSDAELGHWLSSKGVCPRIIVTIPNRGESVRDAIKTISIEELEDIVKETKEARVVVPQG